MKYQLIAFALIFMGLSSCQKDEEEPTTEDPAAKTPTEITCADWNGSLNFVNDPDLPVDYIIDCKLNVSGAVNIAPGTVIQFRTGAGFEVDGSGSISAIGTSSAPIRLEGTSAVNGSWRGVFIRTNDVNNRLEYVEIYHAGGEAFNSNDDLGAVILYATGRIAIDHCTISNSGAYGLNANYADANLTLSNTTFTNNDEAPILAEANHVHSIASSCTFTNNANQYIHVLCDFIEDEVTWNALSIPFRIHADDFGITRVLNVTSTGGLTIEPGTTIEFDSDCGLEVNDGYLEALAAGNSPVIFTGKTAVAGSWKGLFFDGNNVRNNLENVEIAYAGGGELAGYYGSIVVWADTRLSITNSIVRDGDATCGINAPLNGDDLTTTGTQFINIATDVCQ